MSGHQGRKQQQLGRLPVYFILALIGVVISALATTCSGGGGGNHSRNTAAPPPAQPFQELYDQGIDRYLGIYTPMLSEEKDGVFTHTFGSGDGPLCINGTPYSMDTLDAGSEDLMIFLQGGGLCWSELCSCLQSAPSGFLPLGILDTGREDNPVRGFNVVYLDYCDGGVFASDRDTDTDGDGIDDRFQRGLHNLSAGLDMALALFPAPRRVVLVGTSAGGLGTTFALPLVRRQYPDASIDVINDSGVGLGRPGDPSLWRAWIDDWNISAFFPESCPDCLPPDGHLTQYHIWQMGEDPGVRRGMLSYTLDDVMADTYLKIDRETYHAALLEEMLQLEVANPERSRHWIPDGEGHCFLHRTEHVTAGGVPLFEWLDAMLNGRGDWSSATD